MSCLVAALPMYDWPEMRAETDAFWARACAALRRAGIDAPARLARRNADLPAVPGGIRDAQGRPVAPDPATLPPEAFDLSALWRHPRLLVGQTCWGPMEAGLRDHVQVVGQPDYSAHEGGEGALYSSAIVMRRGEAPIVAAPAEGCARLPLALMRGRRLAYNDALSMSGLLALERDLLAAGEGPAFFAQRIETGSHRAAALAVAEGRADVCALDCRTWALVRRFLPQADGLVAAGWTARRKGLPLVTARATPPEQLAVLRRVLGAFPSP
ncbi:phosphate/phosphite/phosphonate ABC transporter substrate-binding protein [Chelativorans intermedius]|uniref:Phosphate/phosphite/phosphonate ABC transporter substrate-binding protein n=1 Tax=Chelativorans intermedius TaxID=515947 RepID=A0ABV6D3W7_9HYPH|nr:PhnD/SsuA/transferrin family substrate-binding protein [Chelativorans intermedius]MCT8997033.1 PhnD/SsuA/transferrin family substrate-binding protein [Chelativorans intermedius]